MNFYNNTLLICFLLSLIALLFICWFVFGPSSVESYANLSISKAQIQPVDTNIFWMPFQNFTMMVEDSASSTNRQSVFEIKDQNIQLVQEKKYLDFQRYYLSKTIYSIVLRPTLDKIQHKWVFEEVPGQKDQFFLFQQIRKIKIYLWIAPDHSIQGSVTEKTPFTITSVF